MNHAQLTRSYILVFRGAIVLLLIVCFTYFTTIMVQGMEKLVKEPMLKILETFMMVIILNVLLMFLGLVITKAVEKSLLED